MLQALIDFVSPGRQERRRRGKVERRELVVVVSFEDGVLHVLTANDDRFHLSPKERVRAKLFTLLRGPWPLICDQNIAVTTSFIHDHVEYDVVKVKPCFVSTMGNELPLAQLRSEPHNFGIIILAQHPLQYKIRQVLKL